MITTVKQFILALGGNTAVAEMFETSPQNIYNWGAAGKFPAWATAKAAQLAEKRGERISRELLIPQRPERKQRKRRRVA